MRMASRITGSVSPRTKCNDEISSQVRESHDALQPMVCISASQCLCRPLWIVSTMYHAQLTGSVPRGLRYTHTCTYHDGSGHGIL